MESTDRQPTDFFHFGAVFFGILFGAAGVVTLTIPVAMFGLLLVAWGMAYFLVEDEL